MGDLHAGKLALGVDIGGTKVRIGLVDENGEIECSVRYPVERCPLDRFGRSLAEQIDLFLQDRPARHIDGIGIGTKGFIDFETQRYVSGTLFSDPNRHDLCQELQRQYSVPVRIDNDLNATVLAELEWGAGRHHKSFTYVNIGTGTAVGIIDNGHLMRGARNYSGEVGLYLFEPGAKRPFIHNLESVVSGGGLNAEVRRLAAQYPGSILQGKVAKAEPIHSYEIFEACLAGDTLARDVVESAVTMLAYTLLNLEAILDSQTYVFGGGVVSDGGWFLGRVLKKIEEISKTAHMPWSASLQMSELGADNAGLLGAACTLFTYFRTAGKN